MSATAVPQKLQTVLLSGSLAKRFGRRHRVAITGGLKDAMGYFKQFPGFEQYMLKARATGFDSPSSTAHITWQKISWANLPVNR